MQVEKQQLFREAGCTGAEFSLSFGKLGRRRFRENCRDLKMHFLAPASLSSQEISPIMKTMFVPNGMPDGFWDIRFSLTTQVKHIWTTLVTFPAEGSFEVGQSSLLREHLSLGGECDLGTQAWAKRGAGLGRPAHSSTFLHPFITFPASCSVQLQSNPWTERKKPSKP